RLIRATIAAESRGSNSPTPSMPNGVAMPGESASDQLFGTARPSLRVSDALRRQAQERTADPGCSVALDVWSSWLSSSTSRSALLAVSRTNNTGTPPSSDGVASTAPSSSSHGFLVATSVTPAGDGGDDDDDDEVGVPGAGVFARSHAA